MGLPMNSILNRMRMDGVSESAQQAFGGNATAKEAAVEEKQIMPESFRTPKSNMKAFHWAKINSHQANDKTLWKDAAQSLPALCQKIEFARLEELFGKEAEAAAQKKQSASKVKANTQLVDPKRQQNVMIGLG